MTSDLSKDECLFCVLEKPGGDEEKRIIHRGGWWYVVLNIYPYTNGHVMVVCRRHVDSFGDLNAEENAELMQLLSLSETAIRKAYQPHGINVGVNLGKSAGAGIEGHLHVHLVPRWHGDTNFMTAVGETRVVSEDLHESYKKLKNAFG